jgi:hypothetical protein
MHDSVKNQSSQIRWQRTIFVFLCSSTHTKTTWLAESRSTNSRMRCRCRGNTIVFAWTPAMVNHKQLTNYTNKSGEMTYEEWCKTLLPPLIWNQMECWYISDIQAKCINMGDGTKVLSKSWRPPKRLVKLSTLLTGTDKPKTDASTLIFKACKTFCRSTGAHSVIGHGIVGKDIPIMACLAKARRWSKRWRTRLSSPDLTATQSSDGAKIQVRRRHVLRKDPTKS